MCYSYKRWHNVEYYNAYSHIVDKHVNYFAFNFSIHRKTCDDNAIVSGHVTRDGRRHRLTSVGR